jgi:AcrR family transcriptional regulator
LVVLGQAEPRRERADAEKNRARILDAARKLMKKRPLDELCMDELAALAGVGKGTLYRRFEDKCALLHALLDDSERALQDDVQQSFGLRGVSPDDALLVLLDKLFGFVVDHAQILAAAEASARGNARFESAPYAWRHAVISRRIAQAGIARGEAAAHVADMLLSTMSGEVVARALTTQPAPAVRAQASALFRAMLAARVSAAGVP